MYLHYAAKIACILLIKQTQNYHFQTTIVVTQIAMDKQ